MLSYVIMKVSLPASSTQQQPGTWCKESFAHIDMHPVNGGLEVAQHIML